MENRDLSITFEKLLRRFLGRMGLPEGDLWELLESGATFPDGAHFRIEVPTVNTA